MSVYLRDGAYRDSEGRLHKVCRNWAEAKKRGLPAPCPNHGEDEVWACHGFGWSTHTALRLVPDGILALCKHCDPDRNPEMRPTWWGNPKRPVLAGWERTGRRQKMSGLTKLGHMLLANVIWAGALIADGHLRYYAFLRPYLIGQPGRTFTALILWCGVLLALWLACLLATNYALRHQFVRRSAHWSWAAFSGTCRRLYRSGLPQ